MTHSISTEMKRCIENCTDCSNVCFETINHCLGLGGDHTDQNHIQILQVCAEICHTAAKTMLLGSDFHSRVCGLCAEICERCAQSCESISDSDETMDTCAKICRRCAVSCQEMVGTVGGRKDDRRTQSTQPPSA